MVVSWRRRIAALPSGLAHAVRGVVERRSAVALLPLISCETLVIAGDEDSARPPEWSRELVRELSNAHLWQLPATGHSVILEQPDIVIEPVLQFLCAGRLPESVAA